MLSLGLSTATAVRVANAVGRADQRGLVVAGQTGFGLVLALVAMVGGLIALQRDGIAALYTTDPAVLALAAPALGVVAIVVLFDGAQTVILGALRGAGDVFIPTVVYALSFWVLAVPAAYLTGLLGGGGIKALHERRGSVP